MRKISVKGGLPRLFLSHCELRLNDYPTTTSSELPAMTALTQWLASRRTLRTTRRQSPRPNGKWARSILRIEQLEERAMLNTAPVAHDDFAMVNENTGFPLNWVTIDFNDIVTDAERDVIRLCEFTSPAHGSFELANGGTAIK